VVQKSVLAFLADVLSAAGPRDFIIFPVKLLAIGLMIAVTTSLTALSAGPEDDVGQLTARGFVRGMLAIMMTSGFLSLAA
jgi:ABC-type transporter Mla maintaining outer membrane lipid asymmetry permease subunit MlaE